VYFQNKAFHAQTGQIFTRKLWSFSGDGQKHPTQKE